MNPIKLSGKRTDGKDVFVWACGECGFISSNEEMAKKCCSCLTCGTKLDRSRGYTNCDSCREKERAKSEEERFQKAEKLESWDGWVYLEGAGYNEGYFRSLGELVDFLEDDEREVWPEYIFICKEQPFPGADIDSIIENVTCEMYEDAADNLNGLEELEKAINAFNEANKNMITYYPDYKRMVKVPKKEN
jgi:hypothetical protein